MIIKKIIPLFLVVVLFLSSPLCVHATEQDQPFFTETTVLDNGFTIIDEFYEISIQRASSKYGKVVRTIQSEETLIAVIELVARFQYDGSTVTVLEKTVTRADTYNGWQYSQTSLTSSGGTVTLLFKVKKSVMIFPYSLNITCDVNGNLS